MPFSSGNISDLVSLLDATVVTATSTGAAAKVVHKIRNGVVFTLDVTAAATAAGDTLDVYVQALMNGTAASGSWTDVVHFTQVLGNGGAKRYMAKISAGLAETMFENATALSAGAIRNIIGDQFRVRYVVASASAPSFTFSVTAQAV